MKKLLLNIKNVVKNVYREFTFTNISSIFIGILGALMIDSDYNDLLEYFLFFFISFGLFCFLIESIKKKKYYFYIISAVISIIFTYVVVYLKLSGLIGVVLNRLIICFLGTLFVLSLFFNYKKSNCNFSKYIISFIENIFLVNLISSIILGGLLFIIVIIDLLLLNGLFDNIFQIYIIYFFVFYVPAIIYYLRNFTEVHLITKIILGKIIYSICLAAYLVVYYYMIKIFVIGQVPANQLFLIISLIFILSVISSIILDSITDCKLFSFINKYIHLIFIPMLGIQIYSLFIRISDYGLTTSRYIGIIFIVFEIIAIIIRIFKKDIAYLIVVLDGLVVFFVCCPFINISYFPLWYESKILEEYKVNHILNDKVVGAFDYISDNEEPYNFLDTLFTSKELYELSNNVFNYKYEDEKYTPEYDYLDLSIELNGIDISNYNYFYSVDESNIHLYNDFDIKLILSEYVKYCKDNSKYFDDHNVFETENAKLIIYYVSLYYDTVDCSIDSYYLSGYILKK